MGPIKTCDPGKIPIGGAIVGTRTARLRPGAADRLPT
jgi:hypothetical protein